MPDDLRHLRREHVEAFIIDLLGRWAPATVNNRYRGCQAFFRWCIDEDVIPESPMAKMKPPKVPEQPTTASSPRTSLASSRSRTTA